MSTLLTLRLAGLFILLLAILFTAEIQIVVNLIWEFLRQNGIYSLACFETLHVPIYGGILLYLYYHSYKRPSLRKYLLDQCSRMKRPEKRDIILQFLAYVLPLLLLDCIKQKKYHNTHVPDEWRKNWIVLYRPLPAEAPALWTMILQLFASLVIYDALFFVLHLAMHRVSSLAKIHSIHHGHEAIDVDVTNKMDVGERLAIVLSVIYITYSLQFLYFV